MKAGLIAMAALFLASSAEAQPSAPAEQPAQQQVDVLRNKGIVASTPGADGVLEVHDDGTIKHLQSGLVCPASFPNVRLFGTRVYPSAEKGADIGCDYIRADPSGRASAKLTLFATKAPPGVTLDAAFQAYQREVTQVWRNLRAVGPAMLVQDATGKFPEFRSEEYLVTMNGSDGTSDLVVTIDAGWIIEIRATYAGRPNEIGLAADEGVKNATLEVGDRVMANAAFVAAIATVGK